MYTMEADGVLFHDPSRNDPTRVAIGTEAKFELNKPGSLTFTLPPENVVYHALNKRKSIVTLYQDGEVLFRGRVIENVSDLYNMLEVYCEGEMSLLMDSIQPAMEFDGTAEEYLRQAIRNHNAQMDADKQFVVGEVTAVTDENTVKVKTTEYTETLGDLRSLLVDEFGGYLRVRYSGGARYLDYIKEYTDNSAQSIKFGVNLVDIEKRTDTFKFFTVLLPLGKVTNGKRTTIESVNGGSIYIEDASAIAEYGRIIKTQIFDDVTDPRELLEKGTEFAERMKEARSITVRAVDMKIVDPETDNILLGDRVKLDSFPHDLNETEICTKVVLLIDTPEQSEYTFGMPPETLTDMNAQMIRRAEGATDKLREWLTVTDSELTIAKELISATGDTITNVMLQVDALEAEIKLLATENQISDLVKRVSQAEIDIDGAEAAIDLKADRTTVSNMEFRLSEAEIAIDGANAAIELKANQTAVDEMTERITQAEIDIDGANASIALKANQSDFNGLDKRLSQAEVDIDAANERVDLWAGTLDEFGNRLNGAEVLINGMESKISLKADKSTVEEMDERLSQAEVDIDGANAAIALKANQSTVSAMESRLSQAEVDINGAEAAIALKANLETVENLTRRVSQAEIDINGAEAAIALKANKSTVDGLETQTAQLQVKYNQISTKVEDNEGNISTLTQTVNGFSDRVEDAEENISTLTQTSSQFSTRLTNAEGNVSVLSQTVSSLNSRISNAEGNISTLTQTSTRFGTRLTNAEEDVSELTQTVGGLTSRIGSAEGNISTLTQTSAQFGTRLDDAEDNYSALSQTVNGIGTRVGTAEGNISVLTQTVNGFNTRVKDAEDNISTLTQTSTQFRTRLENAEGDISTLENTIDGLTSDVSDAAGNISTLTNTVDGLTNRVEDAEGNITTLQTTSSGFETRVANAEGRVAALSVTVGEQGSRIDAQAETISLKADKSTVDGLGSRLTFAEAQIDGANAFIALKASKSDLDALDGRVSSAELRIDGAEGAITAQAQQIALKASQDDLDAVVIRLDSAEDRITLQAGEISLKANKTYVDDLVAKYVTADELKAEIADSLDIFSELITTNTIDAGLAEIITLNVLGSADISSLTAATLNVGEVDFATHSHKITANDDGTVTLGEVSSTGGSFNIADTQYYKNGVSAAYPSHVSYVAQYLSTSRTYDLTATVTSANGHVKIFDLAPIDASGPYNGGRDAGIIVGYGRAQNDCELSISGTTVAATWADGTSKEIDATPVYNTGWNDCRSNATRWRALVNFYPAGETLYDAYGNVATGPWYKGTDTYLYALPAAKS